MLQIAPGSGISSFATLKKRGTGSVIHPVVPQAGNEVRFSGRKTNLTLGLIGAAIIALSGAFFARVFSVSGPQSPYGAPSHIVNGIDMAEVGKQLEKDGLTGTLHAAAHDKRQYVFTYRDPDNFFNNVQISLALPKGMDEQFKTLNRHDKVRIKGHFL
jgi:hypothetical protein